MKGRLKAQFDLYYDSGRPRYLSLAQLVAAGDCNLGMSSLGRWFDSGRTDRFADTLAKKE